MGKDIRPAVVSRFYPKVGGATCIGRTPSRSRRYRKQPAVDGQFVEDTISVSWPEDQK